MPKQQKKQRTSAAAIVRIRSENIGRLLVLAFRRFEEVMVERMRFHGFTDIRQVHTSLLRYVDLEGTRLTVIAERAGMHKQAVGQLASEVEALGYVRRVADPTDGRALLVQFTTKGRAFLKALPDIHEETQEGLTRIIGAKGMAALAELLIPIAAEQRRREERDQAAPNAVTEGQSALSSRGKRRGRKPRSLRPEVAQRQDFAVSADV